MSYLPYRLTTERLRPCLLRAEWWLDADWLLCSCHQSGSAYPESINMSTKQLKPSCTIADNPSEVFTIRFSPDGKYLAAGCNDGAIRVYNAATGAAAYAINVGVEDALPCTALRFRPAVATAKTKNVLLSVNANGKAQHWHIASGRCLHTIDEVDNQIYAVDYKQDGSAFATAGKDKTVRIYDEATKSCMVAMSSGTAKVTPGHSNRIFSVKFHPEDPNIVLSGGWDNTVQIWDVRTEHSVRSIFGPHICGDSLDMANGVISTGSWRPHDALELWDFGSGKRICAVDWYQGGLGGEPCMLYTTGFSQDASARFIGAGGSGANEARVFDTAQGNKVVGAVSGLSRGVFSVDFHEDLKFAVAGGDAAIRILDIVDRGDATDDSTARVFDMDIEGGGDRGGPVTPHKVALRGEDDDYHGGGGGGAE